MARSSTAANRRDFLLWSTAAGAAAVSHAGASPPPAPPPPPEPAEPAADPEAITERTIVEAQKLAGITFTTRERRQMVGTIGEMVKSFSNRAELGAPPNDVAPATVFRPASVFRPVGVSDPAANRPSAVFSSPDLPLPDDDESIAFAPTLQHSHWIRSRAITSRRLTEIYLERLRRHGPALECVITLTEDLAMKQARKADEVLAAGTWLGPLHGIPWGAKDLLDTEGIRTTWGAGPYRDRVPESDATVVARLADAGCVLVAKLSLGALAYNDIWFGGRTNNPWNLEQGSSGSSAGSAAAVAAGLASFTIGTETYGSIVSPCMRCGATGLRPTFGRVGRGGAMALCWSLDKIGPICRRAEDCALVLDTINGADPRDPSSIDAAFEFNATRTIAGLRVGFDPAWFEGDRTHPSDRAVLEAVRAAGARLVELSLPEWPYESMLSILYAEAAAAFEELTRDDLDDELVWQAPVAWPNTFRQSWFVPAIEYVQAQRFRRQVAEMMEDRFADVDLMIGPSFAGSMLLITNNTGHPSLTLRTGFNDDGTPHGITLWGRLFGEDDLVRMGTALEEHFDVWDRRPQL